MLTLALLFFAMKTNGDDPGYFMDSDKNYFSCTSSSCTFGSTPSQMFKKVSGKDGQNKFQVYNEEGIFIGQCLDREKCHSSTSNARYSSCDHCGAVHWGFSGNKLAEDKMANCIQFDGYIRHCKDSFAYMSFVSPTCKVKSTKITDLKCVDEVSGGVCGSAFTGDSISGAGSENDCNACSAAPNSTLQCTFSFAVSTSHTISTTFSSSTAIMIGTEFSVGLNLEVVSVGAKAVFSVTETLTYGETKQTTSTQTVTGGCQATIKAGTRESATANFLSGTLMSEFSATVTTEYDCPWKPDSKEPTTGTITITDVPTQSMIGSCKTENIDCKNAFMKAVKTKNLE